MSTGELLVFDVETTGTDRRRDQIIELCVQFGLGDDAPNRVWRIRPDVAIEPAAQEVHGISMDDLAECPRFPEVADELRELFASATVLVGYNVSFDIGMLQAEYERLGQFLDLGGKDVVDAFRLWQQCEPRSLQHAHKRFVGSDFAAAHSAAADVAATGRVLSGMLEHFGLADQDWGAVASVCEPERATWVGPSHHVRWSPEGQPVLGFGKHNGKPLETLARLEDGGYLRWIMNKDFPPHVREICARALELPSGELVVWLRATFGVATPVAAPAVVATPQATPKTAPEPPKREPTRKKTPASSSQLSFL
ncbi:3'-5' exonuclease [Haliangium ochraceum]|uniref:Exonuclease RNase T and DNA polymerase III n=1 Tax=Haliangium ochraceum (strain DSM 14365 / JCM 11303 / SMP-2) TaxID=502025 RepID=D0LL62_HALO1|nr:3'-5' exonuclease [Haliangium ochraceum]ACY18558.1 Exonuclease RNase T and DNA polymerase III [Haliangium ochraceum DSM 14365]